MRFEDVTCNLCGRDEVKKIGRRISPDQNPDLETEIVRCVHCGLIYPNPMPRPAPDEIQKNFDAPDSYFASPVTSARIKMYEKALERIERFCPGKGRLLDVGCGRGELIYAASKRGWQAIGQDVSASFADFAKKKFGITVITKEICDLGVSAGSFDVACLNSVIQYVPDPMSSLNTIRGLLRAGGLLYVEVTNEDALVFKFADFIKNIRGPERITTHLSPLFPSFQIFGFNRSSLAKALELAGFRILWLRIRGLRGGGRVKGRGLKNLLLNITRSIIIFIGGLTGKGHLIYCIARKVA